MHQNRNEIGLLPSLFIFGIAAWILFLETHYLIPWLGRHTGLETIICWFLVAGFGMFLPMLMGAYFRLKMEGHSLGQATWENRLRFKKMTHSDWYWSIGGCLAIGVLSLAIIQIVEWFAGKVDSSPAFMSFEPLSQGRCWILLAWLPYWLLNIMGEEILWRGVMLPGQERVFGKFTWLIHGTGWGIFHLAFGWQLLLTLIPILYIQSYIVQRRKNSWIGVVIHAVINGPSFIAIALGWL